MKSGRLWCVLIVAAVLGPACSRPTVEDRNNRRVLDEILTAITLKNPRLLEDSAKRATQRHDDKHLTDEEYQGIEAFINKGRQGDWSGADHDGYAFRKQHPFVKPGP